jgi:hypothetical protein
VCSEGIFTSTPHMRLRVMVFIHRDIVHISKSLFFLPSETGGRLQIQAVCVQVNKKVLDVDSSARA